jgi:hypothetical protein
VSGRTGLGQPCRLDEILVRVAVFEIMPSDHCNQFALRIRIAIDVPLGGLD